ncbi:MAG: NADH-quinone oxidoreductase subunit NuoN [Betaproteobacteria bacterium]|jgi:NADH-quinone oxidoreductase subunit N|nr:NADH-quinone oxidoreductase subunit NuoN [Candidatus Fonsibacter lacus]
MNLFVIYPEIFLLIMACLVALLDLWSQDPLRLRAYLATLMTLAALALWHAILAVNDVQGTAFGGMVVQDTMGSWLKSAASLALLVTLVYAKPYAQSRDMLRGSEMFSLSLLALLGMFVMMTGNHLLLLYLGLELLTLSSYALVALRRDDLNASEAAMKYFVLGAMASGFMLYGMSMMYGATGTLELPALAAQLTLGQADTRVLALGVVFVVAGLAFKLGAVPFHMWVPDVYEGAPTAVTLMLAAAPKLAAFALAMRLLVAGFLPLAMDWQPMLALLAVMSLLVGNLAAIAQRSLKRMLAFSTISHVGFLLLGLVAGVSAQGGAEQAVQAYSASMFYALTYVLTTLATFGVMLLLSREGFESDQLQDFAGLNQRSPWLAAAMAACMFSLAGVPPLVGFYAKFAVLQVVLASHAPWALALVLFALLMSLVGAFYYLRLIKIMYFDQATQTDAPNPGAGARLTLTLNVAAMLALGLLPGGLLAICTQAMVSLLV